MAFDLFNIWVVRYHALHNGVTYAMFYKVLRE